MNHLIKKHVLEHRSVIDSMDQLYDSIEKVAVVLINCLKNEGTIFWCGNGGSAADSQHLAGELVGRFCGDRRPLKSISLNADTAVMTCIVNDYGYEHIFSRQIEGIGTEGDVLIGISTSGNSININNALIMANQKKIETIGLLGKGGGDALNLSKYSVVVPSDSTARVQEMHILIGHILCDMIEEGLDIKVS
jgi:D-sedoheptulose 7-phosphate isomerase